MQLLLNFERDVKHIMKKIKLVSIAMSFLFVALFFTGCGKELLSQKQIEDRLLKIIEDATISEINFIQNKEETFYEGKMYNTYAEYYFKLDGYTGKTLDWERTIKYLSEDEFTNQLIAKYPGTVIDQLTLVTDEEKNKFYNGIIFNNYSYYEFTIDAFNVDNVLVWEDVTADFSEEKKPGKDEDGKEFCGEYSVKMKLKNLFDIMILNSCELTTNDAGEYIYAGQLASDTGVYLFTADAYTGEIIEYDRKNK